MILEHHQSARARTSYISSEDLEAFAAGMHARVFDWLGAHLGYENGLEGAHFAVWAPGAERVSVAGDFGSHHFAAQALTPAENSEIWTGFIAGVRETAPYRYQIVSRLGGRTDERGDPAGFFHELWPGR